MDVAAQIAMLSLTSSQLDLPGPELLPSRLMRATAQVLPVAAAGISFFSSTDHRVPLGASEDSAVLAERLQFTVGQGPCLSAHLEDQVILATAETMARRWPIFHNELLAHTGYRAIVSLPIDGEESGAAAAVDLYYTDPSPHIGEEQLEEIDMATDIIGDLMVASPGLVNIAGAEPVWLDTAAVKARSQVWIAIGMLNLALDINAVDALALLRSYAYGRDSTVDDIARLITDRALPAETLTP